MHFIFLILRSIQIFKTIFYTKIGIYYYIRTKDNESWSSNEVFSYASRLSGDLIVATPYKNTNNPTNDGSRSQAVYWPLSKIKINFSMAFFDVIELQ